MSPAHPAIEPRRIPPAKLAHIVLRTPNYDEIVRWWATVLAAEIRHTDPFLTFLTYDDEHHRIAILRNDFAGAGGPPVAGLEHVAFTFDHLDDLLSTYLRLKGDGIDPVLTINHGMTFSMYFADPDGNQVELQIDIASAEEAEAFMASDVFADNPIGVLFDPDDIVARRRAGESVESLTTYVPR